jgi:(p)ppGpp synthase/HD superfamily hydrolase
MFSRTAVLHDTIEDTEVTFDDLKMAFGETSASMSIPDEFDR